MLDTTDLFDLSHTLAADYLSQFSLPWEALAGIHDLILALGQSLGADYRQAAPQVWVHRTAVVAPTAYLGGPCIIGAGTEIRHGAFIRGSALVGRDCVVGNSVELKNAILFDRVQVPHFNYVGDSILGFRAHMGAGSVTSNVKSDQTTVSVAGQPTGLQKLGAMVGDFTEVGCNAVLNPGTVLGRGCTIYPTACVRGILPAGHIWKADGTVIQKI